MNLLFPQTVAQQSYSRFVCTYSSYLILIIVLLILFYHEKKSMDLIMTKNNLKGSVHTYQNTSYSNKLTVFILNYNRPKNFHTSLPLLSKMDIVGEIIVSHGWSATYEYYDYPKVKNIKDFELNTIYGPAVRFMRYPEITNDIVLYLDDDILPEEELIYRGYNMLINQYERNTLFGVATRTCNQKGYSFKGENSVLTPFLMVKKSVISDYVQYGLPIFMNWMKEYRGNCEDLSINVFVKNFYHETIEVIAKHRTLKFLDRKNGISSHRTNHLNIRNTFCKMFYNQTFVSLSSSSSSSISNVSIH